MKICVFGLGEVGMRFACLCLKKGHEVFGIDVNEEVLKSVNSGISRIKEKNVTENIDKLRGKVGNLNSGKDFVNKSDVIIVCVPTPVDENYQPDMKPLESACKTISSGLKKGHLIVIESSVFPSCTERYLKPVLESGGMKAGTDFNLAHCPERIDPGNSEWTDENIPRVIGGITGDCARRAAEFYKTIVSSDIMLMDSVKEAEATKLLENVFRDINIAYVNEMAMLFEKLDIDVSNVIRAAATKPFGYKPFYPGPGIGGDCISVNTYYMIAEAYKNNFDPKLLKTTREVNNHMVDHVIDLLRQGLEKAGMKISEVSVSILGMSYKKNVSAVARSPSINIIKKLKGIGINPKVYDPYIKDKSTVGSMKEALNSDCIIIATDHTEFLSLTGSVLRSSGVKVVIDSRNMLDRKDIEKNNIVYKGIGR